MSTIQKLAWTLLTLVFPFAILAQSDHNLLQIAHELAHPAFIGTEENQRFLLPDEMATGSYVPKLFRTFGQQGDTILAQVLDRMEGNPFIGRGGSSSLIWILADAQTSLGMSVNRAGASHAPASGFRVTTVADGIAKFLVNRAKEELSIAFFRQFKEDLEKDPRLGKLFPTTTATLQLVDKQVYQFGRYLEALRESFIRDFKVMPTNLNTYLKDNDIIQNLGYKILAEEALDISQLVVNGTSPEEIIDYLSQSGPIQQPSRVGALPENLRQKFGDMAAGFQTAGLVSHSLYSGNDRGYLEPIEVSDYLKDGDTRILYLGLLWQFGDQMKFSTGKSLRDYLGTLAVDTKAMEAFFQLLTDFADNARKAEQQANANRIIKTNEAEIAYEPYYQFFTALLELFESGVSLKKTIMEAQGKGTALEDTLFLGIRHLNDLNFDIRQRHYAAAINDLMYVLRVFVPNMDEGIRGKIFNYGQFIATVSTAENSDEVAAAIEAVALPPGSSRVKKQNEFSAAVNAYLGGTYGKEVLSNNAGTGDIAGLSAPVGFTVSWMLGKATEGRRTPGSFSLFAPIIDVGALATFRFNDPLTNDLPDLKWSNLLAPGIYGVFGFPRDLPISIGLGAQRGPNLRTITTATADIKASGWRYGVFLSVDIPVFNLYVQSGQQKNKNKAKK
jgi:hypothetical protein